MGLNHFPRLPRLALLAVALILPFGFIACDDDTNGTNGPLPPANAGVQEAPYQDPGLRGNTQNAEKAATFTKEDLQAVVQLAGGDTSVLKPAYDVAYYKVTYTTLDWKNRPVTASGAVAIPVRDRGQARLSLYMHGTVTTSEDVPSQQGPDLAGNRGEYILGVLLASTGGVVAMPDYLGFGEADSTEIPLHPYMHARTEAMASIDILRTGRQLMQQNTQLAEKPGGVFLYGYSQGGHATMATHRALEREHTDEFSVFAAAPMSGAYSVSGVMRDLMESAQPYPHPMFLPYVFFSYQQIYGVVNDRADVIRPELNDTLHQAFQEEQRVGEIDKIVPGDVPLNAFREEAADSIFNTPNHPLIQALRLNDIFDWLPSAPVNLIFCTADRQVPHPNSLEAFDAMSARGADVRKTDVGDLDHVPCVVPAVTEAIRWLQALEN